MTPLTDLPTELLISISDEVYPADLVNFACACKQLHSAATRALSHHRKLQRQYGNVGNHDGGTRKVELPDLLKEVLDNRRLSFYIRRLGLRDLETTGDGDPRCDPADLDRIFKLAKNCGLNPLDSEEESDDYVDGWYARLKESSEETFAALVISQLTRLSTLEWQADDVEVPYLFLEMCQKLIALGSTHLFPNLTTVVLQRDLADYEPGPLDIDVLAYFMDLPSVKTIHARNVVGQCSNKTMMSRKTSNVTTLVLSCMDHYNEDLIAERLEQIIACPRRLSAFTYNWPEHGNPPPFKVVRKILNAHARENLLEMTARDNDDRGRDLEIWSDFHNLDFLGTDLSLLLPEDETGMESFDIMQLYKLVEVMKVKLPPSLKHIRLYEDAFLSTQVALQYLPSVVAVKGKLFPNLQRLELCLFREEPSDEARYEIQRLIEELSASCQAVQMEFKVRWFKQSSKIEDILEGDPRCLY